MIENRIEQHISPVDAEGGQDVEAHALMAIRTDALLSDCFETGTVAPRQTTDAPNFRDGDDNPRQR